MFVMSDFDKSDNINIIYNLLFYILFLSDIQLRQCKPETHVHKSVLIILLDSTGIISICVVDDYEKYLFALFLDCIIIF